jgi:hypothetical protein
MRHYEISEWADFARNLLSGQAREEMEQHLASGCTSCGATLDFLRNVAAAAAVENLYESATPALVSSAHELFEGRGMRTIDRVVEALQVLAGHMTYDSASDLLPQGTRAHRASTRQMMFEAGDYCLDLRIDRELDSSRVTLVGQLASQKDPRVQMARLQVLILSGDRILSQTASNEFGEFSLECVARQNVRLCVPMTAAGVRVEIPLKQLLEKHEG